ncbi:ArsR/SmtB family transcription factor [Streptomyces sp. URMC 128]|uniref:ArsR/SmtB family transcription factor n=1 Tax=Streptomyces sp. URMC 128 TaxID=3423404 RepID=UPI003F1A488D
MVVEVDELNDETVDRLFHALADATRRDILRRCVRGELSVSRLAEAYPMSFAAVQKHVAVLERAGLVSKQRSGREQLVRTDPDAVGRARQALDELESAWRGRVDRMARLLAEDPGRQEPEEPGIAAPGAPGTEENDTPEGSRR